MCGPAPGMDPGAVGSPPGCVTVGPIRAIALAANAVLACYFFVTVVKNKLKYDDSLDVFGIHGVGGIVGAVLTGVFSAGSLGGVKGDDYSIAAQLWIQIEAVAITLVWSGVISYLLYKLIDMTIGLRVDQDTERQGLDLVVHGEQAYHG